MEKILIMTVVLVFIASIIPNILLKSYTSKLTDLLLNNEYDEFNKLINSKIVKLILPTYNREYILLNSYLILDNFDKVKEQYNKIFNLKLSKKQERIVYLEAFNYFYSKNDRDMVDKVHNHIQTFEEEDIRKENQRIYDICVLKKANHIEEMEEEYNKNNNKDLAMMLYLQYKNINDDINAKKYKELMK